MNSVIEKLLQPVSVDQPCGLDLSNDSRLTELESILKGKPAVEVGTIKKEAEPPEWPQLKERCIAFLGVSKDLRPATYLCCSLLHANGLTGFRDGLQLLRGLIEQFWTNLHPLLDPTDDNDPTQRLNILRAFASERGTVMPDTQQWLGFADYLYTAPLGRPKAGSPITLDSILTLEATGQSSMVGAQFGNCDANEIRINHQAAREATEALAAIDNFLTATLGSSQAINLRETELQRVIDQIEKKLAPYLQVPAGAPAVREADVSATGTGPAAPGGELKLVPGAISSRQEVLRAIDCVCEYYGKSEPGSPVPLLLRRAQKLATMNFIEAMQELNLATVEQLKPILGSTLEGSAGSAQPASGPSG